MQLIRRFDRVEEQLKRETLKVERERERVCVKIHIRREVVARLQEGAGHLSPWRSTGPNPFHLLPLPNTTLLLLPFSPVNNEQLFRIFFFFFLFPKPNEIFSPITNLFFFLFLFKLNQFIFIHIQIITNLILK